MRTLVRHVALFATLAASSAARAQVTVTIDPAQDARPISPLIYGINYVSDEQVTAAHIPLTRWGGNATTRYNYQIDVSNTGNDYFFENLPGCWNKADGYCANPPANPQEMSGANAFLQATLNRQQKALFTVSTIGWVAKAPPRYAHPFECGCPRSAGNQDQYDQYDTNCGNGKSGNNWIDCGPATTTSLAVDSAWTKQWVSYLVNKFGPSNGRIIYQLDNEPALWSDTHHDVHPTPLTYDEMWQRMRDNAVAILDADPTALISGPAEWGWPNYLCSAADDISKGCTPNSPDRAKHGGEELVAWLLDQAKVYEQQNGRRILHYLDLHYYPQGGNPPEITRSLYDGSYTDPSWINEKIRLIPRMHDWVDQHYPGTRISVSEYDFYHHNEAVGAVTYAEVLGIFGREGLDAATAWSAPDVAEAAFGAFRLYGNYDGKGSGFESTSVRTTVSGAGVQAFGAIGSQRATVVLVNEGGAPVTIDVGFGSFKAGQSAEWYTLGAGSAIDKQPDVAINAGTATVTLGATSIGMVVASGMGMPPMFDMSVPQLDASGHAGDGGTHGGGDAATARGDGGPTAGVSNGCGCRAGGALPGGQLPGLALVLCALVALALRQRRS